MAVTALEGVVAAGQIRLLSGKTLPEHTRVYVIVPESEQEGSLLVRSPRLVHKDQARDFEKTVIEVDDDAWL
jgi:hypothetical protein